MLFDQQYAYYAHNQGVLNPFCYQFQQIPSEHKISEFEEKIPEPQVE